MEEPPNNRQEDFDPLSPKEATPEQDLPMITQEDMAPTSTTPTESYPEAGDLPRNNQEDLDSLAPSETAPPDLLAAPDHGDLPNSSQYDWDTLAQIEAALDHDELLRREENAEENDDATSFFCGALSSFCTWDEDSRTVAKVMMPLVLTVILATTLGLVFAGPFNLKSPSGFTGEDVFRDIIAGRNLVHQETWEATKDPNSPQAKAYEFVQNDAITNKLLENLSRKTYFRVRQRFALATLYYATDGSNWDEDTNWLNGAVHECGWFSTFSQNGDDVCEPSNFMGDTLTYRGLWLKNNNLSGPIPSETFDFLSLRSVDFAGNALNGTLDEMVGRIPRLNLRQMNLHTNNVTGSMDKFLKYFQNLESLSLLDNRITGTIPPHIGTLGWLRLLALSGNQIEGPIPSELGLLTGSNDSVGLETLFLDNNKLTGNIPKQLGNLTHLTALWLHHNNLAGPIPNDLQNLVKAETIFLASNQLNNTIPTTLLSLSLLQELDISNNELTGTIGSQIEFMSGLQTLRIANNSLSGSIPAEIDNCSNLQLLDLSGNAKMSGSIPQSLCSISSLQVDCVNLCGCNCGVCGDNDAQIASNVAATNAPLTEASTQSGMPSQMTNPTGTPNVASTEAPTATTEAASTVADETTPPTASPSPAATDTQEEIPSAFNTSTPTPAPTGAIEDDDTNMTEYDNMMTSITNTSGPTDRTNDVCYFVLAGQSNVLGFADLGHLEEVVQDESYAARYGTPPNGWTVLEDVFVTFDNEYGDYQRNQEGTLTAPSYGTNRRHFGPEVGFGFEMADLAIANGVCASIVLVKTAGVAALAKEWNAPDGAFFQAMMEDVEDALDRVEEITRSLSNATAVLAGVVWFHGYADVYEPDFLAEYEVNLERWIGEARQQFSQLPNAPEEAPLVIGQMGGQGLENPGDEELEMRAIQESVVATFDSATIALTNTSQFVTGFNASDETQVFDRDYHYFGRADVILNIGEQMARDMWSIMR